MSRHTVIIPVVVVVDTGPATAFSSDQAISTANTWLVLPSLSGLAVAAKSLEGKVYSAEQYTNAQLAGTGPSIVKEVLA